MSPEQPPPLSEITRVEILKEARNRIEDGWCQGTQALDPHDEACSPVNPYARRFCLFGALLSAIHALAPRDPRSGSRHLLEASLLSRRVNPAWLFKQHKPFRFALIAWNDAPGRTQAEVVAFLEDAIADLK